jgi:hypothetical protein
MTIALAVLSLSLAQAPPEAVAVSKTGTEQVRAAMRNYVSGERLTVIPFGFAGLANIAAGSVFLTRGNAQHLTWDAGWCALAFGVVELAAGIAFNLSNAGKARKLDLLLDEDPKKFAEQETKRLQRIRDFNQPLLLGVEAVVAGAGALTAAIGYANRSDGTIGLGLGLAVEALILYVLDWTVLDRARGYASVLETF